jgi:hypothetical protein
MRSPNQRIACRTASATTRLPRPYRLSSISILMSSPTSSRHGAMVAIEPQRTGEFSVGTFGEYSIGIDTPECQARRPQIPQRGASHSQSAVPHPTDYPALPWRPAHLTSARSAPASPHAAAPRRAVLPGCGPAEKRCSPERRTERSRTGSACVVVADRRHARHPDLPVPERPWRLTAQARCPAPQSARSQQRRDKRRLLAERAVEQGVRGQKKPEG